LMVLVVFFLVLVVETEMIFHASMRSFDGLRARRYSLGLYVNLSRS
jgi:hypothetical protein